VLLSKQIGLIRHLVSFSAQAVYAMREHSSTMLKIFIVFRFLCFFWDLREDKKIDFKYLITHKLHTTPAKIRDLSLVSVVGESDYIFAKIKLIMLRILMSNYSIAIFVLLDSKEIKISFSSSVVIFSKQNLPTTTLFHSYTTRPAYSCNKCNSLTVSRFNSKLSDN